MLQQRRLATIRAALRFWREEMSLHDAEFSRPYFDVEKVLPLNSHEVDALLADLNAVRYVLYDRRAGRLVNTELLTESSRELSSGHEIAIVLIRA